MKYKGLKIKNVMLLAILMLPALTQAAAVSVFVDSGNTNGPWDGRSWNTAFKSIQRGIDTAYNAGGGDVWVVAGTYYPTNKTNRSKSFQLKSGTNVYGGFNGTETALNQRDWKTNPTTLSGDIGKKGKKEDNSFHVVIGADNALLDGFTITGGYGIGGSGRPGGRGRGFRPGEGGFRGRGGRPPQMGPGSGGQRRPGGIHTSPQAILSGIQQGTGAGMVNYQTAPVVRNCAFKDNHAFKGGAVYNLSPGSFPHQGNSGTRKQPVFENSSFIGNSAKGRGGAMANDMRT
ncbi:MAG: hypothetical protein GY940_36360, partial [bacterium]|nr:hypothetical protein [bacterium]